MHGINADLVHLIKSIMKTWNINLEVTTNKVKETIGPIKVNRGILQGDSFCVRLFTLSLTQLHGTLGAQKDINYHMPQTEKSPTPFLLMI